MNQLTPISSGFIIIYLDMLGCTRKEILNLTCQQITPTIWREIEADIVKNQITLRGCSDEYEKEYKEYIKKDGTILPIAKFLTFRSGFSALSL